MVKVAVIGAGMSGAACAGFLASHGFSVSVFDKGRKHGGRLASRVTDQNQFDYGAQYLTAKTPEFQAVVSEWLAAGWIQPWKGRFGKFSRSVLNTHTPQSERYVAVPSMHSLSRYMLANIEVHLSALVTNLERDQSTLLWLLNGQSFNGFDFVVVTLPPVQANSLAPNLEVAKISFDPCWAVMVSFEKPLSIKFDGATIEDRSLSWIARDSSKPERPPGERWVMHGSPTWSTQNLEAPESEVIEKLLSEFFCILGAPKIDTTFARAHKWRYARATTHIAEGFLFDEQIRIGYCGDWCAGDRIESAYSSGINLAKRICDVYQSSQDIQQPD